MEIILGDAAMIGDPQKFHEKISPKFGWFHPWLQSKMSDPLIGDFLMDFETTG